MANIQNKSILAFLMVICFLLNGYTQKSAAKQDSARLAKFYTTANNSAYWFSSAKNTKRAGEWLTAFNQGM